MLGGLIVTRNGPLERFRTFLLLISTVTSVSRHRPSLKSSVRPQPAAPCHKSSMAMPLEIDGYPYACAQGKG